MTDYQSAVAQRKKEEAILQFDYFNNETALELGMTAIQVAKEKGVAVVIEIILNGCEIFHYSMPGTNPRQCMWVKRKANMVHSAQMSSLHAGQTLVAEGKDLWVDWRLDDAEYATIGGGFPIAVKGCGIIGSIACSGLPHEDDHRLLVVSLSRYLNVTVDE